MSEFGMQKSNSQASFGGPESGRMDWYNGNAASYGAYNNTQSPHAYYQPQQHTSPSFMPVSNNTFSSGDPSTNFADEPPLLEELGIDLGGILSKTRAILLHRLGSNVTHELDMGGALMFIFLLGGLHLLMGRLHFGIILGWSVVHSMILWFLVNQLADVDPAEAKGLDLYSICCLVGYCLAPLSVSSALGLMLPRGGFAATLAILCTLWSAMTAAKILVRRCPALEDYRMVIALPCTLMFAAFTMLALY